MGRDNKDKKAYCNGWAATEKPTQQPLRYEHKVIWANDRIAGFIEIASDGKRNLTMPREVIIDEVVYKRVRKRREGND